MVGTRALFELGLDALQVQSFLISHDQGRAKLLTIPLSGIEMGGHAPQTEAKPWSRATGAA